VSKHTACTAEAFPIKNRKGGQAKEQTHGPLRIVRQMRGENGEKGKAAQT